MSASSWRRDWRRDYGAGWAWKLGLLSLLLIVRGALDTLGDADLPLHLALGEWIVKHRAVVFIEPFAWTRQGAPYYSYSWLPDVVFYGVAAFAGGPGLRILNGLLTAAAGAAMIVVGRSAGWSPRTTLLMASVNVAMLGALVASVRPQALLFTLLPLAWACTYSALHGARPVRATAALFVVSAITANVHLMFMLTALPWMLWIAAPPQDRRRIYGVVAAVLIGWICSPYGFSWIDVLRLNLAPNPLVSFPSPIVELWPGFVSTRAIGIVPTLIAVAFTALPWMLPGTVGGTRRRTVYAVAWGIGLIGFASAARLLVFWWFLIIPLAAECTERASSYLLASEAQGRRLARIVGVWLVCAVLVLTFSSFEPEKMRAESPMGVLRSLPTRRLESAAPLAGWLQCNARPRSRARLFTTFNYGSYFTWRLPDYSSSIDARTTFPDSVTIPEKLTDLMGDTVVLGPWRTADLAILPTRTVTAAALDTVTGWRRAAVARTGETLGLWVRESWWRDVSAAPLPLQPLELESADGARCGYDIRS